MCKRNLTVPFKFFCYTDDSSNLHKDVCVIPFVDHMLDIIVHNKLFLFSYEVEQYLTDGPRLYFDLDLIIEKNVDFLLKYACDDLTLIRSSWRGEHRRGFPIFHHMLNSSCMVWKTNNLQKIWNYFIKDPEFFSLKYHYGMDSFLSYECENIGIDLAFFPERIFMSHEYGGIDFHEQEYYFAKHNKNYIRVHPHVRKQISIVLLNGPNTDRLYPLFKQYYSD
jgi:hypothetical protein